MSINYRELRERLPIEEVLRWMGWQATQHRRDQLRGCCPFCTVLTDASAESACQLAGCRNRNFSVNTRRKIYHCFRCGSGGNALDLWSRYRELPIYAAAQEIQTWIDQNKQPQKR